MATVQGSLRMRSGAGNTLSNLIETFNTMHDMIIQSGMVQVSDSDFAGQSKLYSADTGPGLTQVVKNTSSNSDTDNGYKVYKHPKLSLYFKISFIDFNQSTASASSFAVFKYQFATELNGAGEFNTAKSSINFVPFSIQQSSSGKSYTVTTNTFPATFEKTTVSCGDDYFWISRDKGIEGLVSNNSYYSLAERADYISVGIFASDKDPSILCLVRPQYAYSVTDNKMTGARAANESEQASLRYMLCNNGAWSILDNGAAGQLDNPRVTSTIDGVRVAQGKLIVNQEFHRFNFGFIPYRSLNSFSVINLNLTGVIGKYQALPYMGFANHSPPVNDLLNMSSLIFPIVE